MSHPLLRLAATSFVGFYIVRGSSGEYSAAIQYVDCGPWVDGPICPTLEDAIAAVVPSQGPVVPLPPTIIPPPPY